MRRENYFQETAFFSCGNPNARVYWSRQHELAQPNKKMKTIEQDKKAVAKSLSNSAGHNTVDKFAVGQIVKVYHGSMQAVIVEIKPQTLIVKNQNGIKRRILRKNVSIQLGVNMYGETGELAWIESLLAAQKRYYKTGSIETAIAAN